MWELLTEAARPANMFWTTLLVAVVVYWLMVILGALDLDFLDIDFDGDADADMDADGDADVGAGGLQSVLSFFYIGEMPIMIVVSLFVLAGWFVSVTVNYSINPGSFLMGTLVMAVALAAALLVSKIVGFPIMTLFRKLNVQPQTTRQLIGKICTVISSQVSETMGQAEVPGDGAPVTLNAKCITGAVLKKGDEAVVVSQDPKTGIYYIEPFDLEN